MSKKWYKLDNMGTFYSLIATKNVPNTFRYSVTLTEEINANYLQTALDETVVVFPNFNVNLKKGFFWYYLDETNKKSTVTKENLPICFRLYKSSEDFLYRVSYYNNRINFEVSHILSDARGSLQFFRTLVCNYLKINYSLNTEIIMDNTRQEKIEDSFDKYYKKTKLPKNEKIKIYRYKGKMRKNKTRYMECHLNCKEVLEIAHKYNASLTVLLVSVLIYSFRNVMSVKDMEKEIKIDIPVDLRNYFKSTSSRNFFGLTSVHYKFNDASDTLENIIECVKIQFEKNITVEKLSERVNKMVAFEKNIFCRIVPVVIKNFVLKSIDKFTSTMRSSCVSNIGKIEFEEEFERYIKEVNILSATIDFQFTICSYKNDLSIGISSKYRYNDVIKNFCRFFSSKDLKVQINASEVD